MLKYLAFQSSSDVLLRALKWGVTVRLAYKIQISKLQISKNPNPNLGPKALSHTGGDNVPCKFGLLLPRYCNCHFLSCSAS